MSNPMQTLTTQSGAIKKEILKMNEKIRDALQVKLDRNKADFLERTLTFDTTSHPFWRGMEGKCWVNIESQKITIVGWMSDMGAAINNYRLVVQYKKRAKKSGITQWIELVGFDDSGKGISKKVYGTSMAGALDAMFQIAQNGATSVNEYAAVVASLCTVHRSNLDVAYFV
jgi:hypothetical protein